MSKLGLQAYLGFCDRVRSLKYVLRNDAGVGDILCPMEGFRDWVNGPDGPAGLRFPVPDPMFVPYLKNFSQWYVRAGTASCSLLISGDSMVDGRRRNG